MACQAFHLFCSIGASHEMLYMCLSSNGNDSYFAHRYFSRAISGFLFRHCTIIYFHLFAPIQTLCFPSMFSPFPLTGNEATDVGSNMKTLSSSSDLLLLFFFTYDFNLISSRCWELELNGRKVIGKLNLFRNQNKI